ncbi:hypothetical protein FRT60_23690 [Pseudomonas haemolytica]|uniref:Uncharacterized protein n=1 Tax=Pseudomonas haemolytica TaxID=2600065 RepID=A0A646P4L3_9PSED|nr:hypothetical protein [Pseudomonas haemolytica]
MACDQGHPGSRARTRPGYRYHQLAAAVSQITARQLTHHNSKCGSGLARESGGSVNINVCWADAFASKPAPTFDLRYFEHFVRLTDWH